MKIELWMILCYCFLSCDFVSEGDRTLDLWFTTNTLPLRYRSGGVNKQLLVWRLLKLSVKWAKTCFTGRRNRSRNCKQMEIFEDRSLKESFCPWVDDAHSFSQCWFRFHDQYVYYNCKSILLKIFIMSCFHPCFYPTFLLTTGVKSNSWFENTVLKC